jgi:hypothetical protein
MVSLYELAIPTNTVPLSYQIHIQKEVDRNRDMKLGTRTVQTNYLKKGTSKLNSPVPVLLYVAHVLRATGIGNMRRNLKTHLGI